MPWFQWIIYQAISLLRTNYQLEMGINSHGTFSVKSIRSLLMISHRHFQISKSIFKSHHRINQFKVSRLRLRPCFLKKRLSSRLKNLYQLCQACQQFLCKCLAINQLFQFRFHLWIWKFREDLQRFKKHRPK